MGIFLPGDLISIIVLCILHTPIELQDALATFTTLSASLSHFYTKSRKRGGGKVFAIAHQRNKYCHASICLLKKFRTILSDSTSTALVHYNILVMPIATARMTVNHFIDDELDY